MSLPHILLGFLAEPSSVDDLKKTLGSKMRHFWSADLSQIYRALHALERDNLVRPKAASSAAGPQRRVYLRTAAGTRAFKDWLAQVPESAHPRAPYLAQMFFLGQCRDWRLTRRQLELVQAQLMQQVAELRALESAMAEEWSGFPDALAPANAHSYFTFRAGLLNVQASLAWCRETLAYVAGRAELSAAKQPRKLSTAK